MSRHLVEVKVWGKYACFTRPENKVERLSYPIITPSAAVGVLEAIYWKPEFYWEIIEIGVLPHPDRNGVVDWENYMPITLNELACEGREHPLEGYNLEDHRVQRTCMVIRWPCYLIRAKANILGGTTNAMAIRRQFTDRVSLGQCYHQPYLGLREFTAFFAMPTQDDTPPPELTRAELGRVFHSSMLRASDSKLQYRFVPLSLNHGWFDVTKAVKTDDSE